MRIKLLVKYLGIGIVSFSLTCTHINAQDRDFGGLNRYAQENKDITISHKTVKVVFMGNSITEGWVNTTLLSLQIMDMWDVVLVGRPHISSCCVFVKML